MELQERLLVQVSTRDVHDAPTLAGHPRSGLVLTGQAAPDAIRVLRRHGYDGPLLADRRRYAGSARVRGTSRLSSGWIERQVAAGATVPLTDSGYVGRGDHEALRAVLDQAGRWEGAVAVLPVHVRWVVEDRDVLLRTVARHGVPVALVVEDGEPYRPVPLPLLSAGAEALGALAYGAGWAAIGVREVLRHLHPEPHEPHEPRGGWRRGGARSAFVPERLEFVPVERLGPGTCDCPTCQGRPLRHLADAEELVVNTHNTRTLHHLHTRLLNAPDREHWWHTLSKLS